MLPDTDKRLLLAPLFQEIDTEVNAKENKTARSIPDYLFDSLV
jgi:hypothetical protein